MFVTTVINKRYHILLKIFCRIDIVNYRFCSCLIVCMYQDLLHYLTSECKHCERINYKYIYTLLLFSYTGWDAHPVPCILYNTIIYTMYSIQYTGWFTTSQCVTKNAHTCFYFDYELVQILIFEIFNYSKKPWYIFKY